MCGPLAMSLPGAGTARWRFVSERVAYNLGRAFTYTLLGGAVGALGALVSLSGYQQGLSIAIGAVMVLGVLVPWVARQVSALERRPARLMGRVMRPIQGLYRRGGLGAMLAVGVLNGLLPCGFVYAALATALAAGTVGTSMAFMAAFGLGTVPAMLALMLAGRLLSLTWRRRLQRLVPLGLLIVGTLLILRGLALGSFLSPDLREAIFSPGVCRFLPLVDPPPPSP
jgi:sulfite exporter TauE/SafE